MHKANSLLLAAGASVALFTSPAFAGSTPSCPACSTPCSVCVAQNAVKPYPIKVVTPTNLPRTFVKSTVTVALSLDEKGVPSDVRPLGWVDKEVASRLVAAVSEWRFSPMYVDGKPVAGEFKLPIVLRAEG